MKKIINITRGEEVNFTKVDLPILVHGKEHSGASLLSITIASLLHEVGNKLCIFTAYPMAKEEFLKQITNVETVFYLEKEEDFEKALKYQTIILQSGNVDLFLKIISNEPRMEDRILFVKNIETINIPIFNLVSKYSFMVSGDLELNAIHKDFIDFNYSTQILFSNLFNHSIPALEKYQAFMKNKLEDKIIIIG
ncbi:MAG: hypothetical protein WCP17_00380 [bacterium]